MLEFIACHKLPIFINFILVIIMIIVGAIDDGKDDYQRYRAVMIMVAITLYGWAILFVLGEIVKLLIS